MTEIKILDETVRKFGQVQIADEVIAIVAGTAALETEGVSGYSGGLTNNFTELLGRKDLTKGVKISVVGDEVTVDLNIFIKYGYNIPDVTIDLQRRVQMAIENMTGLKATSINVNVSGLSFDKAN